MKAWREGGQGDVKGAVKGARRVDLKGTFGYFQWLSNAAFVQNFRLFTCYGYYLSFTS